MPQKGLHKRGSNTSRRGTMADNTKQNQPLKLQAPTTNLQQHCPGSQQTPNTNPNKITSVTNPRSRSYTPRNEQKSHARGRIMRPTNRRRRESERKGREIKLHRWGILESTWTERNRLHRPSACSSLSLSLSPLSLVEMMPLKWKEKTMPKIQKRTKQKRGRGDPAQR